MSTTLPPHLSFFTLPAELRKLVYWFIPNAIAHRPIPFLASDGTASAAKVRTFVPASTIRQTCKFIAHEAKPLLVRQLSRRRQQSLQLPHPFSNLILEQSDLALLTAESSVLSIACRWRDELLTYDRIRRNLPRSQREVEFRDDEFRYQPLKYKYRDWEKFEAFKRKENILHLGLETLARIEMAGRTFRTDGYGHIRIQIVVDHTNDGGLPSEHNTPSDMTKPEVNEAMKAMAARHRIRFNIYHTPPAVTVAKDEPHETRTWMENYGPPRSSILFLKAKFMYALQWKERTWFFDAEIDRLSTSRRRRRSFDTYTSSPSPENRAT